MSDSYVNLSQHTVDLRGLVWEVHEMTSVAVPSLGLSPK